jgi:hypothetical protein
MRIRFEILLGAKEHEMHHGAKLMLIEREPGIVPHLTRQRNQMLGRRRVGQPDSSPLRDKAGVTLRDHDICAQPQLVHRR